MVLVVIVTALKPNTLVVVAFFNVCCYYNLDYFLLLLDFSFACYCDIGIMYISYSTAVPYTYTYTAHMKFIHFISVWRFGRL